jgi:septum formation protein
MKKIVLASASKRRSAILSSCGIKHKVIPSNAAETRPDKGNIRGCVVENAQIKALYALPKVKDSVVIGADTLVLAGKDIIGKPGNKRQAKALLRKFSAKKIDVFTGLFIIDVPSGRSAKGFDKSSIFVKRLDTEKIDSYFNLLMPYDKAGGFSIEGVGSIIFDKIRGSYFNILGLPMHKLDDLFGRVGLDLVDFIV